MNLRLQISFLDLKLSVKTKSLILLRTIMCFSFLRKAPFKPHWDNLVIKESGHFPFSSHCTSCWLISSALFFHTFKKTLYPYEMPLVSLIEIISHKSEWDFSFFSRCTLLCSHQTWFKGQGTVNERWRNFCYNFFIMTVLIKTFVFHSLYTYVRMVFLLIVLYFWIHPASNT